MSRQRGVPTISCPLCRWNCDRHPDNHTLLREHMWSAHPAYMEAVELDLAIWDELHDPALGGPPLRHAEVR